MIDDKRLTMKQRERLAEHYNQVKRVFDSIWGMFPPSSERDKVMTHLHLANQAINEILTKPEQMEMEDFFK